MKKFKHIAFLCGYFNINKSSGIKQIVFPEQWEKQVFDNSFIENLRKFFYYEFIEFCYGSKLNGGIESYKYKINKEISISSSGKEYVFILNELQIYLMPYNIMVYSIGIEINTDDLNYATKLISDLRSILYYKEDCFRDFINLAINPIKEVYSIFNEVVGNISFYDIIENGNKLKVFQIINSSSLLNISLEDKDMLLFETGTLSPIGLCKKNDNNGVSTSYLADILTKNKISYYNNWSALSLLDSFTILSEQAPVWLLDNWSNIYFRMIYLHGLFQKFYLFRLNVKFRKCPEKISAYEEELLEFESRFCFHKISYNFLPLEIYKSVDKGLEITEERNQLNHIIEMENMRREKKNDKKVNNLLIFLTLLTMFSTIWDSSCLFNEIYPYNEYLGSTIIGFKTVALLLSLSIVVSIFIIFKRVK